MHTHTHAHTGTSTRAHTHTQGVGTFVAGWKVTNLVGQELGNHLKVLGIEYKPAGVDTTLAHNKEHNN